MSELVPSPYISNLHSSLEHVHKKIENLVVAETLITGLNLQVRIFNNKIRLINSKDNVEDWKCLCLTITPKRVNGEIIYSLLFNHFSVRQDMFEHFGYDNAFYHDEEGLIEMIKNYFSLGTFE